MADLPDVADFEFWKTPIALNVHMVLSSDWVHWWKIISLVVRKLKQDRNKCPNTPFKWTKIGQNILGNYFTKWKMRKNIVEELSLEGIFGENKILKDLAFSLTLLLSCAIIPDETPFSSTMPHWPSSGSIIWYLLKKACN